MIFLQILLQASAEPLSINDWLFKQLPVIVVMGLGIWWLAKQYSEEKRHNRQQDIDNIKLITNLNNIIDRLHESNKETNEELKQLKNLLNNRTTDMVNITKNLNKIDLLLADVIKKIESSDGELEEIIKEVLVELQQLNK